MNTKVNKTLIIASIAVIISALGISHIIAQDLAGTEFDKSLDPDQEIVAKIDSHVGGMESQKQLYQNMFLQEQALYDLGPEWDVLSVDYSGSNEPFAVTRVIVTARLIDSQENSRQCKYGTEATIIYDANTGNVVGKNVPLVDDACTEPLSLGPRGGVDLPDFIPQADGAINRAYLTSEQGSPSGHHGGYGKIKIPSLDETGSDNIYDDQDKFVGFWRGPS